MGIGISPTLLRGGLIIIATGNPGNVCKITAAEFKRDFRACL